MKLVLITFVFTGSLIFNFIYSDTVQWAWLPHYGKIFDILLVIFRSEFSTLQLKITISPEPVICKMSTRIKFYFWRQNDRHFLDLMFWKYLRIKSWNSHASLHIDVAKSVLVICHWCQLSILALFPSTLEEEAISVFSL